jgi:uncharacterized protein YjbJ (UPF0337 family)
MTDDRISGSAKNIGGQLEEGFGRVTGDEKMQLEGRARQAEGTLQDVYGQAKETGLMPLELSAIGPAKPAISNAR